jgi:hypothetical protein
VDLLLGVFRQTVARFAGAVHCAVRHSPEYLVHGKHVVISCVASCESATYGVITSANTG